MTRSSADSMPPAAGAGPRARAMSYVDAHVHYHGDHPDDLALLAELDLRLLNVSVPRPDPAWRRAKAAYRRLAERHPERYAWCGGFAPPAAEDFERPAAWVERALAEVRSDLAAGAVAIKVWKSIGLEIRKPCGRYLMIDDEIFDPIFGHLAEVGVPLLAHIGEPRACWRPLTEESPHAAYYARHPEWHMAGRPDVPSHEELIAARDRVLEKHPQLRVVGAHLGSLEYDVGEIAARFERYPGFAVDTSSRLLDLALQDRERVRGFFRRHADRIVFGTDLVSMVPSTTLDAAGRRDKLAAARERWRAELAFLATDGPVVLRGREVRGLGLAPDLVDTVCRHNPRRWYPRL